MNPVCKYDFTLPVNENYPDHLTVINSVCKGWCKSWCFQKERGDTGYEHWQGRVSLIKKRRLNDLVTKWCVGGHISITSGAVSKSNQFDYVMKADTCIEGPWIDTEYEDPPPLTRQLKDFLELPLRPWQQQLKNSISVRNDRSIILVYDPTGNSGKSIFAEYLEYQGLAWEVPPMRNLEDIMQCCMSIKPQTAYLVDLPRAMKKDKLSEFYSGLESLKNGTTYDKRYNFRKRRMDRPQVVVFSNTLPCWDYMSQDRWEVYQMVNLALVPYNVPFAQGGDLFA